MTQESQQNAGLTCLALYPAIGNAERENYFKSELLEISCSTTSKDERRMSRVLLSSLFVTLN